MSSREHIIELAKQLEREKNASNTKDVLKILDSLSTADITISILKETGLGKTVNLIRKSEAFKHATNVKETANTLLTKWKAMATAVRTKSKNGTKKKNDRNNKKLLKLKHTESNPLRLEINGNNNNNLNDNDNDNDNNNNNNNNSSSFIRESFEWQTGNARRDKMISKFISVLKPDADRREYGCFMKLAQEIEQELVNQYGADSEEYVQKYRDLHFNIKKNKDLKIELLLKMINPSKLVTMSSEEMANKSLKERRDRDKKWAMEEARNDHGLNASQAMTDEYKCGKCKQRKCKYSQAQTRSADEPMTTFVTCLVCGNRWKC